MTEVLFYHLSESTLEDALPGLIERAMQRGWRAVLQTDSDERRDALDAHLWTYSDDSFLAHGRDNEPHPGEQPVIVTSGEGNPNGSTVRFLVDGAEPPADFAPYERVVFMFDGHDAAQLEVARKNWKASREAGHGVTYWQQSADRRWEKKA